MANVPTQLSPGVNITEIDLSAIVRETANNITGFVGQFRWGPASESLLVDSERRLTDIFLNPTDNLPEKMQDDFFNAANFFRYSDKLKIVRVVHENAKNARAGQSNPANPILIHNDEEFFSLAGLNKNYSGVVQNANWIARYPGDIGNSIEVRAIGAGTFITGSVDDPTQGEGNGGNSGDNNPPGPSTDTFYLPLISGGQLLNGVTYAVITVPQITEIPSSSYLSSNEYTGLTWSSYFIGLGATQAGGNTFGVKYLCFYLKGSSYCNNPGSFPIPGGSYSYIPGSSVTGGLTYSAYYRDRWFYGTFGSGQNETDGSSWTKDGPLLAARNMLGLTLQGTFGGENRIFNRSNVFGKGFHQCSTIFSHGEPSGIASKGTIQRPGGANIGPDSTPIEGYQKYTALATLNDAAREMGNGYWAQTHYNGPEGQGFLRSNPWCLERPADNNINETWKAKPITTISNLNLVNAFGCNSFTFPSFAILPFDNDASPLNEPYTNEFKSNTPTFTYRESNSIAGISFAGLTMTRTISNYRNIGVGRNVVRGFSGGATFTSDLAQTPLRPVIDAFPGITAAGNKGMLLLFAFTQNVVGITTGFLSIWHAGITHGSPAYVGNSLGPWQGNTLDFSFQDGEEANPLDENATNVFVGGIPGGTPRNNIINGFDAEFDASFFQGIATFTSQDPNVQIAAVGLTLPPSLPSYCVGGNNNSRVLGGQAIPLLENEISLIKDFVITKKESQ